MCHLRMTPDKWPMAGQEDDTIVEGHMGDDAVKVLDGMFQYQCNDN